MLLKAPPAPAYLGLASQSTRLALLSRLGLWWSRGASEAHL